MENLQPKKHAYKQAFTIKVILTKGLSSLEKGLEVVLGWDRGLKIGQNNFLNDSPEFAILHKRFMASFAQLR